jgi:hypothetical protein
MANQSAKLLIAVSVLLSSFFVLNAFTKAPGKSIVTGGGFTSENVYFNLNAVGIKGTATAAKGFVQFNGLTLGVQSVIVDGNVATIFLNDNQYITVVDDGEGKDVGDQISDVLPTSDATELESGILLPSVYNTVEGGNIQVHTKK